MPHCVVEKIVFFGKSKRTDSDKVEFDA